MKRINVAELRRDLAEVINRVAYGGERFVVHRREKDAVAIISVEDLELLERLARQEEDRIDVAAAEAARAEDDYIPYEQFRAEMGMTDERRKQPVPDPDRRHRAASVRETEQD